MIFRQILHPETGCASYLFGCTGKGALAVVDPHIEHVDEYVALAAQVEAPPVPSGSSEQIQARGSAGVRLIVAIFETHVQADHLSGAQLVAERTGAPIYLHESADVGFPHQTVRDGDEIELGNDYVRVLHTPGHSPDSISLIVGDRVRGDAPWFILTGDTLFVGDAGRPDLTEPDGDARGAASQLYDSLFGKLLALPDDLEIYPAHFAGSACGRAMSGKPSSTIGFERRFNPALQPRSREEFIAFMLADLPPAPEQHTEIRAANRTGRHPVGTLSAT
jgi:glyoxylase-like metal-dependent hydrolase (beta-lactamase superfamily II)